MKAISLLASLMLLLAACGGGSWGGSGARFFNRTALAEADFQAMAEQKWRQAQVNLATRAIDLHAATPGQGSFLVASDTRALQVAPRNVVVQGEADVPASVLNQVPDCVHCPYQDPTGIIRCRVGFCQAYLHDLCTIAVPVSKPENMGPYEMENCILWALGYDLSGR